MTTNYAVDLFAGAGGMSLGFQSVGFTMAAAVDVDPIHAETYGSNFPGVATMVADLAMTSGQSIRDAAGLGDTDLAVVLGGPPCQGFSVGGRRLRSDPRNALIEQFARLVVELRPRYFVLENVVGILGGVSQDGALAAAIGVLEEGGYSVVRPIRSLNAADYGVPQRRRRVFVLGSRTDAVPPDYPAPGLPHSLTKRPTVGDAIMDLLADQDERSDSGPKAVAEFATLMRGDFGRAEGGPTPDHSPTGNDVVSHSATVRDRFARTKAGERELVSRFHRLDLGGIAPTLRAGSDRDNGRFTAPRPIHPLEPRCITTREAARLHSFPDWFEFNHTKWHGFRQIGNAVPPLLAAAVAGSVMAALCSTGEDDGRRR